MTDDMLRVETTLPLSWVQRDFAGSEAENLWHGSLLTLRVANLMESAPGRESESERVSERLEAKLDLSLYLLAQALSGGRRPPPPSALTLMADGIRFRATTPPSMGTHLLLHLYSAVGLPMPVQLPAHVVEVDADHVRVRWLSIPEPARETWEQWLFRQHRRAVQALREND